MQGKSKKDQTTKRNSIANDNQTSFIRFYISLFTLWCWEKFGPPGHSWKSCKEINTMNIKLNFRRILAIKLEKEPYGKIKMCNKGNAISQKKYIDVIWNFHYCPHKVQFLNSTFLLVVFSALNSNVNIRRHILCFTVLFSLKSLNLKINIFWLFLKKIF